jgi:hypothetical protein
LHLAEYWHGTSNGGERSGQAQAAECAEHGLLNAPDTRPALAVTEPDQWMPSGVDKRTCAVAGGVWSVIAGGDRSCTILTTSEVMHPAVTSSVRQQEPENPEFGQYVETRDWTGTSQRADLVRKTAVITQDSSGAVDAR